MGGSFGGVQPCAILRFPPQPMDSSDLLLIAALLLIVVAALSFPGGPGTPRRYPVSLPLR